ncbi:MAG: 50S ribosomal protein L29 [Christensenellales bacterium]|jgi:large subunit ribosomal protein L29
MKAKKFVELTTQELTDRVKELKGELFNLRFQLATGQLQNPMVIRECRKDIARVKTILRDRELKAEAK